MSEGQLVSASRSLYDGIGLLRAASGACAAEETRQVEHVQIELLAGLERDGVFAAHGYRSTAQAVADLLGWDAGAARRRMRIVEDIGVHTALDGQGLPARLRCSAGWWSSTATPGATSASSRPWLATEKPEQIVDLDDDANFTYLDNVIDVTGDQVRMTRPAHRLVVVSAKGRRGR